MGPSFWYFVSSVVYWSILPADSAKYVPRPKSPSAATVGSRPSKRMPCRCSGRCRAGGTLVRAAVERVAAEARRGGRELVWQADEPVGTGEAPTRSSAAWYCCLRCLLTMRHDPTTSSVCSCLAAAGRGQNRAAPGRTASSPQRLFGASRRDAARTRGPGAGRGLGRWQGRRPARRRVRGLLPLEEPAASWRLPGARPESCPVRVGCRRHCALHRRLAALALRTCRRCELIRAGSPVEGAAAARAVTCVVLPSRELRVGTRRSLVAVLAALADVAHRRVSVKTSH